MARASDLTISVLEAVFLRTGFVAPVFPFDYAATIWFAATSAAGVTLVSSLTLLDTLGFAIVLTP